MSDALWQGLIISGLGLGLLFLAMGLLTLLMIVVERLFREADQSATPTEKLITSKLTPQRDEEEIAAAIAVALAHLRSLDICRAELGATLETEPGRWWRPGYNRQLNSQRHPRRNSK